MCSKEDDCEKFEERFFGLEDEDGDDGIACDCEFIVGSQNTVIKGHKLLFSAASKVFKAIFYGNLKGSRVVKIEDLHPEGFQGMKQFIYKGGVNFKSAVHALLIYSAARKYLISALCKKCISYINEEKIRPSEVLKFYEHCKEYNILEFEELCCEIIQKNTYEVVYSEFFLSAQVETVEFLLKSPSLKLESEIEVFDHVERWVLAEADRKKIDDEDISSSFNNLKKHIRFLTMSSDQFVSIVEKSLLLTQEEKLAILVNMIALNSKPMPENICLEQQPRVFKPFIKSGIYLKKYMLSISIDNPCSCFETIHLHDNLSLKITCIKHFDKYICFQVEWLKKCTFQITELINIKAKLRVISKDIVYYYYDDLSFENEFHILLDWNKKEDHQKMVFARIPLFQCIQRENYEQKVEIEGIFNIFAVTDW